MTLTPALQKMFEEKTKKVSSKFHELDCCLNEITDLELLRECLKNGIQYIYHFEDYYLPMLEKSRSDSAISQILYEINLQRAEYSKIFQLVSDFQENSDITELKEGLKIICNYINEIESKLTELGFKY